VISNFTVSPREINIIVLFVLTNFCVFIMQSASLTMLTLAMVIRFEALANRQQHLDHRQQQHNKITSNSSNIKITGNSNSNNNNKKITSNNNNNKITSNNNNNNNDNIKITRINNVKIDNNIKCTRNNK